MDVLTCDHISFGYENQIAVDQVSFSLKQGDFLCMFHRSSGSSLHPPNHRRTGRKGRCLSGPL